MDKQRNALEGQAFMEETCFKCLMYEAGCDHVGEPTDADARECTDMIIQIGSAKFRRVKVDRDCKRGSLYCVGQGG